MERLPYGGLSSFMQGWVTIIAVKEPPRSRLFAPSLRGMKRGFSTTPTPASGRSPQKIFLEGPISFIDPPASKKQICRLRAFWDKKTTFYRFLRNFGPQNGGFHLKHDVRFGKPVAFNHNYLQISYKYFS
jgi:hypothetical protein